MKAEVATIMVQRGEIAGISAGYNVREWQITDADGKVLDPELMRINFDDDLTFTATRWELLEASLVSVPADGASYIRSFGTGKHTNLIQNIKARMRMRHKLALAGIG